MANKPTPGRVKPGPPADGRFNRNKPGAGKAQSKVTKAVLPVKPVVKPKGK